MATQPPEEERDIARDSARGQRIGRAKTTRLPAEAVTANVEGRRLAPPERGFGPLRKKTYRVRLPGVHATPTEVMNTWKEHFTSFWSKGSRFYLSRDGIVPGALAAISTSGPGGMPVHTGVVVTAVGAHSFTVTTLQGHMFAGTNTFSTGDDKGVVVAQVEAVFRTNDPLWEMAMRAVGFREEDEHWKRTLGNLAAHFGVEGKVEMKEAVVDRRVHWSRATNVRHNAAIGSLLHVVGSLLSGGSEKDDS